VQRRGTLRYPVVVGKEGLQLGGQLGMLRQEFLTARRRACPARLQISRQ
jgi:hypothetical protein